MVTAAVEDKGSREGRSAELASRSNAWRISVGDTIIIYALDPNPKNEEQAFTRAHRINQKREVKVIYMEAVADKISSNQKEDECRSGGVVDLLGLGVGLLLALLCVAAEASTRWRVDSFGML
ncbi:ATP-dependent helicase BRM [Camellia lanceoleosa]|uniref:ATP-dependent helicase BRM n=1 Tax=Camellia lanceoleosa TaxID=1840588 RepID=A0ACC0F7U5_9ERIC|nr:ATP-dependent helicase BRM [Camellia lanceoleosa]